MGELELTEADKARFWSKVDKGSDCWGWIGALNADGYGYFRCGTGASRRMVKAHRVAYSLTRGQVEAGKHLHHMCDNRGCCNPTHLLALTAQEHIEVSSNMGRRRKTCNAGHPMTDENTIILPCKSRRCIICLRKHRSHYNIVNGTNQFRHA